MPACFLKISPAAVAPPIGDGATGLAYLWAMAGLSQSSKRI
jgi:hypothetical protein